MGLFDGQIIKLGNKIANGMLARAEQMKLLLLNPDVQKDVGQSYQIKVSIYVLQNIAEVILETTGEG